MTLKLVTFDLDDTLWNNGPVIARAEQESLACLEALWPAFFDCFSRESLMQLRRDVCRQRPELSHQITEMRHYALVLGLVRAGCSMEKAVSIADQTMAVFMEYRHEVAYFPEVMSVLETLSQHYTLGSLTNGNLDVRRLSIGRYFKVSLRSEDLNSAKPEPDLFLKAMAAAGVSAEETVHVGDSLTSDVAGANGVGIRSIWFNPDHRPVPEEHQPWEVIYYLHQLPSLLAGH